MTHHEAARWSLITGIWFILVGLFLIAWGIHHGEDAVIPSVFACTAIAVACSVYSSRESRKAAQERQEKDHEMEARLHTGTPPPEEPPEDRPPADGR